MFEMDFSDDKDKRFLSKMEQGVRLANGHYEIPLPFRKSDVLMPNNRGQALKRALWQKKKIQRDTKYHVTTSTSWTKSSVKATLERYPKKQLTQRLAKYGTSSTTAFITRENLERYVLFSTAASNISGHHWMNSCYKDQTSPILWFAYLPAFDKNRSLYGGHWGYVPPSAGSRRALELA